MSFFLNSKFYRLKNRKAITFSVFYHKKNKQINRSRPTLTGDIFTVHYVQTQGHSLRLNSVLWKCSSATKTLFLVNQLETGGHRNFCCSQRTDWLEKKNGGQEGNPQTWTWTWTKKWSWGDKIGKIQDTSSQWCSCELYYSTATDPESSCQPGMLQYWLCSQVCSRARTLTAQLIKRAINQVTHFAYLNLLLKVRLWFIQLSTSQSSCLKLKARDAKGDKAAEKLNCQLLIINMRTPSPDLLQMASHKIIKMRFFSSLGITFTTIQGGTLEDYWSRKLLTMQSGQWTWL